jgi:hypothetical protein
VNILDYKPPGPIARDFMLCDEFVRGLRGPIGSGKTGTCIMEIFRRMLMQDKDPTDYRRKSRWAIVRNTNPQLRTTTIKTYQDWLKPEVVGEVKMAPPPFHHLITIGDLEAEVLFIALDTPDDVRKLLSLELTGGFVNEAREVPKSIIDAITSRLRRYPAIKDGGATWSGLIMDTNPPPEDHWWPIMAGEVPPPEGMPSDEIRMLIKPPNWRFFNQPAAMHEVKNERGEIDHYDLNLDAENFKNLDARYYLELITGKTKTWIDVYVLNRLGAVDDGRAVHPNFSRTAHVARQPLAPVPNLPIWCGADFGLTPAAVLAQRVRDRWVILKEIVLENAAADKLGTLINRTMAEDFPDYKIRTLWGDPAGDHRVQTDETTPFQILRTKGIPARPCDTNDVELRRLALAGPLGRMSDGGAAITIDPSCTVLIRGLEGGFCYRRVRTAHGESFADEPDKSRYSHVVEALEYLLLGCGEAREAIGRKQHIEQTRSRVIAAKRQNPFGRLKKQASPLRR